MRPISARAAAALQAGRVPDDVHVAADHPTEFSVGIAKAVERGSPLGPFFIHRRSDDIVVGEIGGGFIDSQTVEIGYAIVNSCWGRGHATDAVRALIDKARNVQGIRRITASTPLERPASGRVLAKSGFADTGAADDEHDGLSIRIRRWELLLHDRLLERPAAQPFRASIGVPAWNRQAREAGALGNAGGRLDARALVL